MVIGQVTAHQLVEGAGPTGGRRGTGGSRRGGAHAGAPAAYYGDKEQGADEPHRSRRSSSSDTMNPNAGHPSDRTERSNQARARVVSPRTRYQLPTP